MAAVGAECLGDAHRHQHDGCHSSGGHALDEARTLERILAGRVAFDPDLPLADMAREFVLSALASSAAERPSAASLLLTPWLRAAAAELSQRPARPPENGADSASGAAAWRPHRRSDHSTEHRERAEAHALTRFAASSGEAAAALPIPAVSPLPRASKSAAGSVQQEPEPQVGAGSRSWLDVTAGASPGTSPWERAHAALQAPMLPLAPHSPQ